MRSQTVILTHEHADFDAIASLLAGALLFPDALPVLPHKLKRNVKDFLSLYVNQFPFIEPRRLPRGHVDQAILVDTRAANAVKGMDGNTEYLVIDHHPAAQPLPRGWAVWQESLGPHTTGANATLLVERLMRQEMELSPLNATLLALGIYEDTGSLLDASTTHRDIRCAAWLVERGARLEVIRRFLHSPPATVSQIMSRGRPRALDEEMPVAAAMELMQRYGHEGFPVLRKSEDGPDRLVGILTRREVDRTLSHRLGALPVHKVMRQGGYTIGADAPIGALHRLMIDSGWGQIPVVDASGELTGIVTRTDLLKLWGEDGEAPTQIPDLSPELERTLTGAQRRLLWSAGESAAEMGQAVYVVGGFVRDLLLERVDTAGGSASVDMDLVVEGDAIRLAKRMQARCGGRVVTHARFGAAKWILDDSDHPPTCAELLATGEGEGRNQLPSHLDFMTARTEFYTEPTVLPTVEQGSIKLDLHRRDFTINTLAIALTPERRGDLLDFYGGLTDLRTGQLRVLHSLSFVDDPTRILRAVRYEQRFNFRIEARTEEHLLDATPLLERVTAARIRQELDRIFQEARPEEAILRLDELGVLKQIHPELRAGAAFARNSAALRDRLAAPRPVEIDAPIERLYWGLLVYELLPPERQAGGRPAAVEEALSERLALPAETRRLMRQLRMLKARLPQLLDPHAPPSATVLVLDQAQPSALLLFSLLEREPPLHERLHCYAQRWRRIHPSLNGRDLRRLGLPPGPRYGEILRRLRTALLDGEIEAGPAEWQLAEAMIHRMLATA